MPIVTDPELKKAAAAFFADNAKRVDEQNVYTVTQSAYQKFMKAQGITEEIQKKITEVKSALTSGGIAFIESKLIPAIEDAKAKGENPKAVKVVLKTSTSAGRFVITGHAHRRYPQPRDPGNFTDVYGVVELKLNENRTINQPDVDDLAAAVRAVI